MALSSSSPLRNPFPPIADYAFLSDWETTPDFAGGFGGVAVCATAGLPSVFGAILTAAPAIFVWAPTVFRCLRRDATFRAA